MLEIPEKIAADMVAHALEEDPNECCGILAGRDGAVYRIYRITNTARSPYRYLMDPQEHLSADKDAESNGWEFVAFYHSHIGSRAYPSDTDVRMALQSGYLDVDYVLVSLENREEPDIRTYRISESGEIAEGELRVPG